MFDDFVALVLYNQIPQINGYDIEAFLSAVEPGSHCKVNSGHNEMTIKIGSMRGTIRFESNPISEEAAISSIGMADVPEDIRERLLQHRAHAVITCDRDCRESPMESMILLIKCGMALCETDGLALCIPACGICLQSSLLAGYVAMNQAGPRAWGIEESEAGATDQEKLSLWESLRREAVPAELVVGFVPAEVGGKTWYFSAGHSLFGMPELTYTADDLNDYPTIREFFRALFRMYYLKPGTMKPGSNLPINNTVTLVLEPLPEKYKDFQASTGTLRVQVNESFVPDEDWD